MCECDLTKLELCLQEVAKRTVTKSVLEMENGDDEEVDFGDEDLFHQRVMDLFLNGTVF